MNRLVHTLHTAVDAAAARVHSGIIGEANSFNSELLGLVKNGGLTAILIIFLIAAWRKGWGAGALLGGILVAAIGYFALNGGLEVIGNMIKSQFGG